MPTSLQGFFWAVFADDSGRERMGAEEIKIKMRLPARKLYDGGVGLADIHRFLAPADLQPAEIVEEELKEAEDQIQAAAEDPSKQSQFELIDVEVKHAGARALFTLLRTIVVQRKCLPPQVMSTSPCRTGRSRCGMGTSSHCGGFTGEDSRPARTSPSPGRT